METTPSPNGGQLLFPFSGQNYVLSVLADDLLPLESNHHSINSRKDSNEVDLSVGIHEPLFVIHSSCKRKLKTKGFLCFF
jgi:hypothetical protein